MEWGIEIIAFLASVAFVAGFIDSFAGGGGLLTIPALMATGVPPIAALATNKLQSVFGTGAAFVAFARAGHIDFRRFAIPTFGAFLGSAAGALAVQQIDPFFLAAFVPILLIAMGLYFLFSPPPDGADRCVRLGPVGLVVVAIVLGFYDGFFGPGAGSFVTTALIVLAGLRLIEAMGNAKLLNFATNLAGFLALLAGGKVLWLPGSAMAVSNIVGNRLGAAVAIRFKGRGVRFLIVSISFALTVKLLADPRNPLWHLW